MIPLVKKLCNSQFGCMTQYIIIVESISCSKWKSISLNLKMLSLQKWSGFDKRRTLYVVVRVSELFKITTDILNSVV